MTMLIIKANTCPYCGGPYTLTSTCYGPRTDTPGENACPQMQRHARLVREAIEASETITEREEVERR